MSPVRARAVVAAAGFSAVAAVVWFARGLVGTPVVGSWADAEQWYDAVGPAAASVATLRVAAMAVSIWLALAAILQALAAIRPASWVPALADLIAPRSLQRLVHGLAGLSLTAGLAVPAPGAGILGMPPPLEQTEAVTTDPPESSGTATMHLLDAPAPQPDPATDSSQRDPAVVVVAPGDSFWSIAEHALMERGAASPDDQTVARYWRQVIDLNRSLLVHPHTPDLIYAGQVFTLPKT